MLLNNVSYKYNCSVIQNATKFQCTEKTLYTSDIYRNNFVNKQAKLLLFRTIERFHMKMRERKIIKLYKSLFIHNMLYKTASE